MLEFLVIVIYYLLQGFWAAIAPFNFTAISGHLSGAPAMMVRDSSRVIFCLNYFIGKQAIEYSIFIPG